MPAKPKEVAMFVHAMLPQLNLVSWLAQLKAVLMLAQPTAVALHDSLRVAVLDSRKTP